VCVEVRLSVRPTGKHREEAHSAARYLTDDEESVRITFPRSNPKRVLAEFTIPKARQMDVVDGIAKAFWNMEDYGTCTIWFPKPAKKKRRTRRLQARPEGASVPMRTPQARPA
jgi:hypothetical protein